MKALVFGETLWDIYPDKKCIGGAAFNFAAHCVGEGLDTALLTAVGKDDLGESTRQTVADFGVDISLIPESEKPTGQCTVTLDENKIPSYYVHTDTAYDNILLDAATIEKIENSHYDMLYFGTLIQRSSVSRMTLRSLFDTVDFPEIFCDINLRNNCYDADSITFCLNHATVLKLSDEEEPLLRALGLYEVDNTTPQAILKALATKLPHGKIILLTRGKEGTLAYRLADGAIFVQESIGSKVVSTVGAGDSFGAAFMAAYLEGKTIEEALRRGAELSGFVVAHAEAVPARDV